MTESAPGATPFGGHGGPVWSVAFAPDGTQLASGGDDGSIRIWDPRTGEQHHQLTGHIGWVWSVAFAPDGTQLASGGDDGTIRIWNPRNGMQVDGTGFRVSRRVGRPLAGVRSDSPSGEDGLGVSADVETLADLIAAMDTRPPLAIALIGDWGAGKSSVMLQVQRRVDVLAEMSRNNPGLSVFASSVRQVRFNAWHYSDEHVWAGLVTELFRTLAVDHEDAEDTTDVSQRHDAVADRSRLRSELAARETEQRRLSAALEAVERSGKPRGGLAGLGSLVGAGRVVRAAIRELLHDVRASAAVVAGWVVLAAAAYAVWRGLGPSIGAAATALAALVAPFVAVWSVFARWHRLGMGFVRRCRGDLEARKRAVQREASQLRERLALIDAAARLAGFLEDRGAASAYQQYRGLLGQVHTDLTSLSEDLRQAHREWVAAGSTTPPPLERIVLYVDDLDRCPPQRVVQVLEAVHLMLALELFVVVVAVDARWLIHSLETHHHELFGTNSTRPKKGSPTAWAATPVDYLDKIFQIPFTLLPPRRTAIASYLRSLLPVPAPTAARAAGPAPATPASDSDDAPRQERAPSVADEDVPPEPAAPAHGDPPLPNAGVPEPAPETGARGSAGLGALGRDHASASAVPDLRPKGLELTTAEVEFLTRLGPLLPTPRAAKRLVNLYRLVRIGIPSGELDAFARAGTGAPYQVVQILLAALVGSPALAERIFQRLLSTSHNNIIEFLTDTARTDDGQHTGERELRQYIGTELRGIGQDIPLLTEIDEYQHWCPILARYSFHTRTLATRSHLTPGQAPHADLDRNQRNHAQGHDVDPDVLDAASREIPTAR